MIGWIGGAIGTAWDFVEDHRDEIALGGAVIAAGIVTLATGGLVAPIIAGAVAAGGLTFGINWGGEFLREHSIISSAPRYSLLDGVLSNTIGGAIVGFGVGSVGSAIANLGIAKTATAGFWNSGIDLGMQWYKGMANGLTPWDAAARINRSHVVGSFIEGAVASGIVGVPMKQAGGILNLGLKKAMSLGVLAKLEGGQFSYLARGWFNPESAYKLGYMQPGTMMKDSLKGAFSMGTTYGVAKGVTSLQPLSRQWGWYDKVLYRHTSLSWRSTPTKEIFQFWRFTIYQPGWDRSHFVPNLLSRLEEGKITPKILKPFLSSL